MAISSANNSSLNGFRSRSVRNSYPITIRNLPTFTGNPVQNVFDDATRRFVSLVFTSGASVTMTSTQAAQLLVVAGGGGAGGSNNGWGGPAGQGGAVQGTYTLNTGGVYSFNVGGGGNPNEGGTGGTGGASNLSGPGVSISTNGGNGSGFNASGNPGNPVVGQTTTNISGISRTFNGPTGSGNFGSGATGYPHPGGRFGGQGVVIFRIDIGNDETR